MNRKAILSTLLPAIAAFISTDVLTTDNDMSVTSEASGMHKVKPRSHVTEKAGASAANAPAATPAEDTKGRNKSKHFHPGTK